MKLAAVIDLLIGAGLAWSTIALRDAIGSPDAWLVIGIGLIAALMLLSGAALAAGAAWGPRLGRASSLVGLLFATAGLVVGAVMVFNGDRLDDGGGAAKAMIGVALLLVFAVAVMVNRTPSGDSAAT